MYSSLIFPCRLFYSTSSACSAISLPCSWTKRPPSLTSYAAGRLRMCLRTSSMMEGPSTGSFIPVAARFCRPNAVPATHESGATALQQQHRDRPEPDSEATHAGLVFDAEKRRMATVSAPGNCRLLRPIGLATAVYGLALPHARQPRKPFANGMSPVAKLVSMFGQAFME